MGIPAIRGFQGIGVKEEGTRFTLQRLTAGDTAAETLLSVGRLDLRFLPTMAFGTYAINHPGDTAVSLHLLTPLISSGRSWIIDEGPFICM